jgi:hypothetical protein
MYSREWLKPRKQSIVERFSDIPQRPGLISGAGLRDSSEESRIYRIVADL